MIKRLKLLLALAITAVLLTACESVPEQPTFSVEWQAHQAQLRQVTHYQASGKLGFKSPELKQSLNFIWKHAPEQSQLRLTTFLGQTVLNLTMSDSGAEVTDNDGKVYRDQNATLLVYRLTGLVIPVTYMQDWLKGLPTEADGFQLQPETDTLLSLNKQLGKQQWRLDYQSYQPINNLALPYAMNLQQAETSVKIVISKWKLDL
jgi:outer membrane lipoprotein LolB